MRCVGFSGVHWKDAVPRQSAVPERVRRQTAAVRAGDRRRGQLHHAASFGDPSVRVASLLLAAVADALGIHADTARRPR